MEKPFEPKLAGESLLTTKLWITRTAPDASRSAQAWKAAGFDPLIAPLIEISAVENSESIPDKAELIFTSANGVRHCGVRGDDRRVYAVGEATAETARLQGFSNVVFGDKDWKRLSEIIEKTENSILHISGSIVRGRLVETLRERGFNASRRVVYRTSPVKKWPIDVETVQAVALYSPLAAEALMSLPMRDLSSLTAYCLSPNVAAPLSSLDVRIASQPNEMSLIACSQAQDG